MKTLLQVLLPVLTIAFVLANSSASSESSVWVIRPDGSKSCQPRSGEPLKKGAALLRAEKIKVLASKKISDGKVHVQICDAETGRMNAYRIFKKDLNAALALGFAESETRTTSGSPRGE